MNEPANRCSDPIMKRKWWVILAGAVLVVAIWLSLGGRSRIIRDYEPGSAGIVGLAPDGRLALFGTNGLTMINEHGDLEVIPVSGAGAWGGWPVALWGRQPSGTGLGWERTLVFFDERPHRITRFGRCRKRLLLWTKLEGSILRPERQTALGLPLSGRCTRISTTIGVPNCLRRWEGGDLG